MGVFNLRTMEYVLDDTWTTNILVSEKGYRNKPTDSTCTTMKFHPFNVDVSSFSNLVYSGHSFCPTSRKKNEVNESFMVVIDVDGSEYSMNEFVSHLSDKPSIYYTTPSNTEENHRFRLVYCLKNPTIGVCGYNTTFEYIVNENNMREMGEIDKLQANQMFNGSYGCEIHTNNLVYKVPNVILEEEDCPECDVCLSEEVLEAFFKYSIGDFLEWYDTTYGKTVILSVTPYVPSDTPGMLVPQDEFMCVPRKYWFFDQTTKQKVYKKWVDGDNRHGKLYLSGLIMRRLNPDASVEELFFGYVSYLYKYIDKYNSDNSLKYDKERILQEFLNMMSKDISDFHPRKEVKHSNFKVDSLYCKWKRKSKNEVKCELLTKIRQEKKDELYYKIDELYDPNIKRTRNEWVKFLKEKGINISVRTFDRFISEFGYSKKRTPSTI